MKLDKFIHEQNILAPLKVASREELFQRQAEALIAALPDHVREHLPLADAVRAIEQREARQSTGLGDGVAIPHARIPGFHHLGFSLAVIDPPLPYGSEDGIPVSISCMVIAPEEHPNLVLKIWAATMRMLRDESLRNRLLKSRSSREALAIVREYDLVLDSSLLARDLMNRPLFTVWDHSPVSEIAYKMLHHKEVATAVVNDGGEVIGEITSDAIFTWGMPEFFTQLQSVSFLRHFNPLEKFFENQSKLRASDVMTSGYAAVSPDATLIEVIFALSVKGHSKVYVVDERHRLLGVIGRLSVLDRAINF